MRSTVVGAALIALGIACLAQVSAQPDWPTGHWNTSYAIMECEAQMEWPWIGKMKAMGMAHTGGLGRLMDQDFMVWVCVRNGECLVAANCGDGGGTSACLEGDRDCGDDTPGDGGDLPAAGACLEGSHDCDDTPEQGLPPPTRRGGAGGKDAAREAHLERVKAQRRLLQEASDRNGTDKDEERPPMGEGGWMCYVYSEFDQWFYPWGANVDLQLVMGGDDDGWDCTGNLEAAALWIQPDLPRRPFFYATFTTCEELLDSFGLDQTPKSVVEVQEEVMVEPYENTWWSRPADYCDWCNCTESRGYDYYMEFEPVASPGEAEDGGADGDESVDGFSETNKQEAGVDEGDIVKTDGTYIFVLPRNEPRLVIATAYPFDNINVLNVGGDGAVGTDLRPYNIQNPFEMLLQGDKLVVIGTSQVRNNTIGLNHMNLVTVQLWDVSDPSQPTLIKSKEVEGWAVTSRLVFETGTAYVVVETYPTVWYSPEQVEENAEIFRRSEHAEGSAEGKAEGRPRGERRRRGGRERVSAEQRRRNFAGIGRTEGRGRIGGQQRRRLLQQLIDEPAIGIPYFPEWMVAVNRTAPLTRELAGPAGESSEPLRPMTTCGDISSVEGLGSSFLWVSVVALDLESATFASHTHAGRGGKVYMSQNTIYLASTNWDYSSRETPEEIREFGMWSAVLKFGVQGLQISFDGLITVPGMVLNQFSMDEHEEGGNKYFRAATTYGNRWSGTQASGVWIFDEENNMIGSVSNISMGERIYSVRFMSSVAHVVTFFEVDPLYVIDLQDPTNPVILGELKVPGWSDYLHPIGDTHLLGAPAPPLPLRRRAERF